jgi:hypothetical protein
MLSYVGPKSELACRNAKASAKPCVLSDDTGLSLPQASERRKDLNTLTTVLRHP